MGYMNIQQSIQKKIDRFAPGRIITYRNLSDLHKACPSAVAKSMERLVRKGVLVRQRPGVFYKPEQGRFGPLAVQESEILRQFMYEDGRLTGYLSGPDAFRALGISTQVANTVTIATPRIRRRLRLEGLSIRFIQSKVKNIQQDDIPRLQLLDALCQIKKVPDVDVDEAVQKLAAILANYADKEKERVLQLAKKYEPRTKALLGAILQDIGRDDLARQLKSWLNPSTSYKIGVSADVLSNKGEWSIS